MIVGSLLLILVAVTLLVLGLANGSSALLISSIAASLLAAVALVVGARQAAPAGGESVPADDELDVRAGDGDDRDGATAAGRMGEPGGRRVANGPAVPVALAEHRFAPPADVDEDPPDEPPTEQVTPAEAAEVARLAAEVLVIDARPRYHLAGCAHLVGRQSESLPVGEAVELGFTPCGRCAPNHALLADARRG